MRLERQAPNLVIIAEGNITKNVTDQDFDIFSFEHLTFKGNKNLDDTGTLRLYGSTGGAFETNDDVITDDGEGYTSSWQWLSTDILDSTSAVNTKNKKVRRTIYNFGLPYVASGSNPTDDWVKLTDSTVLTPT